jgi:glutamyl-tRNA reductase
MESHYLKNIQNYFVAGINYKKSDAAIRGQFAVNNDQYTQILATAKEQGLTELFVLSTCNRTEIYGFAHSSQQLIDLLCTQTGGNPDTFRRLAYIKKGLPAVEHLFEVGAGLDSQILGDYEIVGQLKTAVRFAKEAGFVKAFTERLINAVLQASKGIKNSTQLSGGTVSVSFAAVQFIRTAIPNLASKKILLLGVGKIGRNTCKNLVDYLGTTNITLINRSPQKAEALASELELRWAPIEHLPAEIRDASIILVATNACEPTILRSHLEGGTDKLIIDLSIPYNVEASAQTLTNIRLVNVDELSKLKDETLQKRESEVPKARAIIAGLVEDFWEWCKMREHVPMLRDLKLTLKSIYQHPVYAQQNVSSCPKVMDVQIQRVLNNTAGRVKATNHRGCHYIEAINAFISPEGVK